MPARLSPSQALDKAVHLYGSEAALAAAVGVSQQNLNRAVQRGSVSPRVAIGIHRATRGQVPGHWLRPDLWTSKNSVPITLKKRAR